MARTFKIIVPVIMAAFLFLPLNAHAATLNISVSGTTNGIS